MAAVALLAVPACGDLALEPDRVPTSLTLSPGDTLLTEGDQAQLRVTVLDQDGDAFPGVPSWAPPRWSLSVEGALSVASDGTLTAVGGGEIDVDARVAGMWARARVRVNPRTVELQAPTVYLVQSIQNPEGRVPLVAGQDAFLRVFTTGDQVSFFQPTARAVFYLNDQETYVAWMQPGSYLIPADVVEGRLDRSFNATIPGDVIQPGLEMVVDLDPDGVVPLAPSSRTRVPAVDRTRLDVREMPLLDLTVVPTLLSFHGDEQVFNWTTGLNPESEQLEFARAVLPIGDLTVTVHETFRTSADLTTEEGWSQYLREIRLLRAAEGGEGYYYGTVTLPQGSRWGGLGYIGIPVSVGRPSETTFAHELGHNMGLRHAPCGGAGNPDAGFPYSSGEIGVWGYDPQAGSGLGDVVDPIEYKDLMGYCTPRWVSDYHFRKAMDFRLQWDLQAGAGPHQVAPRPPERVLLLWGGVGPDGLVLEPAFVTEAPPLLPREDGRYRVEGHTVDGRRLFSLGFTPDPVEFGGAHFAFALPYEAAWEDDLDRITLTGPEGSASRDRWGGTTAALLRSAASGRVRAVVRDWRGGEAAPGLRVQLSRGVPAGGGGGGGP